ncbi:cytochrome P450 [Infundibulicybe gibba]|nr:cytochrome P450 [Infundibulicybe gibba]
MGTLTTIGTLLSIFSVFWAYRTQKAKSKLPPGPRRGLLGDHKGQIPDFEPYRKFAEWARQYGAIFSLQLGSTPVIVLNTPKAAWDLLEKKGDIYSSRPRSITGQEILSQNLRGLGMQYGESWRRWRKEQHSVLSPKVFATSINFSISYGNRVTDMNTKIIKENQLAVAGQIPGRFIVESKPLQWFRWEQEKRRLADVDLYLNCLRTVKRKIDAGVAKPSMTMKMLEDGAFTGLSELEIAYIAAEPFSAGVPTVVIMILHPACAEKAQEELDRVIGQSRLPDFDDESSLPYVRALIKETMRWRVIVPNAVPHSSTADDSYDGYHIPKGTTVFANLFMISKDPELFPDPETFRPERFLETQNPRLRDFDLPYGFGRRICPGMHVANQALFIGISRMLWAFNMSPVLKEDGSPEMPDPDAFTSGLARRPLPFKCRITPRNDEIRRMILTEASNSDEALKEWD